MKNLCKALVLLLFLLFCLQGVNQAQAARQPQVTATPIVAQTAPVRKNILIIFGYQSDFTPPATQGLQAEFARASDLNLTQFSEYTDFNRFPGEAYQKQLAGLYAAKYKSFPPDLVILAGRAALNFWLAHRAEIAPDAPVVVFDLTPEDLKTIQSTPNMTGLGSTTDFNKSVDWILQARPNVKEIVFVHGAGPYDQQFSAYASSMRTHLAGKAQFSDWSSYPLAEIKQRAAGLSSSAVIVYAPMFQDAAGDNLYPLDALRELTAVSAVPVLTSFDQFIGTGAIGGYSYSLQEQAGQAARIGLRILRGEAASSIPLNFDSGNQFIFDHLALQHYSIPLSSLPPDSIVKNRQYSFWEMYQLQIITASLIFALLSLVTIYLTVLNRNLNLARHSLKQLNASLESQVQDRTAALSNANARLTDEIAERKLVEQALRESEARFRSYFDLPLIGIAITSPEKGWLQANDSVCNMLGYSSQELASRTWAELTHPDDLAADEAQFNRILAGEIDTYILEKRFIRKNGEIIWTYLSVGCVRKPDGTVDYTVALLADITRRKNVEAALQESEQKYRFLAESMKDVVWIMDTETMRFVYVSPSVKALRGYTPEEIMAEPMDAALTPEGAQYAREVIMARTAEFIDGEAEGKSRYYIEELEQPCKDGSTVWTEVVTNRWREIKTDHVHVLGVSRDISERKQAEAALRAAYAELEQRVAERTVELKSANLALEKAARMKDEFFAAMSHELRTPLTGVLGLAQVLLMQVYGPLNEKQTTAVINIESSGKRLLELINNILDYTHLEAGMIQASQVPFLLEDVCLDCLKTNKTQTEAKHLQASCSIEPRMIILRGDPAKLGQAINHLVNNAIKFTADGGSYGIQVVGNIVDRQVRITAWDTGIGIRSEDFPRLFKPFIQLDARLSRNFSGTGLGLALAKRLVELQGGSLEVESFTGPGSRFSISLPWQPDEW